MLEILTDNRNRTAPEIRKLFEKGGGNLGETGCVGYLFRSKGQILVTREGPGADEEQVMAAALEAGAEDVIDDGTWWQIITEPADMLQVREALEQAGMTIESSELTMIPDTTVTVTGRDAERVLNLMEALEDHDDVQKVHANFDVPDEQMAAME